MPKPDSHTTTELEDDLHTVGSFLVAACNCMDSPKALAAFNAWGRIADKIERAFDEERKAAND
jgi:hypothetical protein